MRSLFLVLLLASPAWAQPVIERTAFPDGNVCETKKHGKDDTRTKCTKGGSYGVRYNADGTIDEFRHGRSLRTLGLVPTWNATRLGPQPGLDLPPIVVDLPPLVAADVPMAADASVVIDAMIVWTPRAQAAQGGLGPMQALVANAVALGNLTYANSLVNAQLRLVYAQRVEYLEGSISADLSALNLTADGKMDEVHALRNQYGADVVTLIGSGYSGYCGLGYFMSYQSVGFAVNAFNVVERSCAGGYLSYAHEVGHNQGLHHDPANASGATCAYCFGYQDPGGAFRTVMSYGGALRIPYLSSATLLYNGKPTGNATQDNSRQLRNNMATVAAFRASPTPSRKPSRPVRVRVEPRS